MFYEVSNVEFYIEAKFVECILNNYSNILKLCYRFVPWHDYHYRLDYHLTRGSAHIAVGY